jgi:enamine deaminase RidA (YjgF/YER057c/UK114 family)
LCEIQAFATLCRKSVKVQACALTSAPPGAIGKVVTCGALRHVYLNGVTGGDCGDGLDFFGQATSMFERAEQCLHHEGLSFIDVQRTWIYLGEMDANYDALNRARNEFFRSRGVNLSPASTGIQGVPFPPDRACALDLRAVVGEKGLRATPIHADTMNEASAYGSRFSRGLHLSLDDRHILYISGTASIDNTGQVVHAGNIEGQVGRMLLNIERLLTSQGATWENLVSATTYLKQPEYLGPFRDICRRRGIPEQVPNTICVADVCRPEWLCEMEAMAILA